MGGFAGDRSEIAVGMNLSNELNDRGSKEKSVGLTNGTNLELEPSPILLKCVLYQVACTRCLIWLVSDSITLEGTGK